MFCVHPREGWRMIRVTLCLTRAQSTAFRRRHAKTPVRSTYSLPNGYVHIKSIQAISDILTELNIDHEPVFEQADISIQLLNTLEAISLKSLGRLTMLAANETRCPHFGLIVGRHTTLRS